MFRRAPAQSHIPEPWFRPNRVDETVFWMEYGEDEGVNPAIELARAKFIIEAVNRQR